MKNPAMFRCILQHDNGTRVAYFGPFGGWSSDLHMVIRGPAETEA